MAEIIQFDSTKHTDSFRQLTTETFDWHRNGLLENYGIDTDIILGRTIPEIVESSMDSYINKKPPDGIIYLLKVDADHVGMGAITKIANNVGEVHRIWIRPEHRGKGYSKMIMQKVLEAGNRFGYSLFRLSTPRFAYAAQHVYKKAGFYEIDEYPDTSVSPLLRQYWIYMEKKP